MADWDKRFLELAHLVASWSKDPSTKVGAVIVRPDKTVASVGFNGFPRGCDDNPAFYEDRELKLSRVVHAEVNAVLNAYERLDGYTLYTSWPGQKSPTCDRCATVVIQAGIVRVVHPWGDNAPSRWDAALGRALQMYRETGVRVESVGASAQKVGSTLHDPRPPQSQRVRIGF